MISTSVELQIPVLHKMILNFTQIAKRAQEQIQNQISDDSPDKIKNLFQGRNTSCQSLEKQFDQNDDPESAKEHFLSAMKDFQRNF